VGKTLNAILPTQGSLNAKRPLGFPAGAIPTVDFLLHHARAAVKKMPVKTHDGVGSKFRRTGSLVLPGSGSPRFLRPSLRKAMHALGFPGGRNSNYVFEPRTVPKK
jgi:hypothetical protein